jgi:RimJ/RimL family protein N-acetyltransferase
MTTQIRQIREEDIESFRETVDIVARERQYLYMTEAPSLEDVQALVRMNIQRGSPHLVLVDGERVVGWCNIFPLGRAVQSHVGGAAMGLRPDWRDKGWGAKLMQQSLTAADTFGFTRVELSVYSSNPRAAALYRKLGFVEEGIKRRSVCIDGIYFDEILMAHIKI